MNTSTQSVAAVVLAYSRYELLQQLIAALRAQSHRPDEIIVINQGSRADIAEWLAAQTDLTVVRQENKGSAGGFCTGIEESLRRGHAWTWIFDDDGIPEPTALEELVSSVTRRWISRMPSSLLIDLPGFFGPFVTGEWRPLRGPAFSDQSQSDSAAGSIVNRAYSLGLRPLRAR